MFVLTTVVDTVRIPPSMFVQSTITSVHSEIEKRYPNRVIMDVGLVICLYDNALRIGDGVCVVGDGAAHHEVVFRLIVFRPFVDEVCMGSILESNEEGIWVSLGGFFEDIFVPAYWMLRPSHYDNKTGLWVWTPAYDDNDGDASERIHEQKREEEEENKFEMDIGSQIRFKVKAINFTQVTNTAKGVQATTITTTSQSRLHPHASSFSVTPGASAVISGTSATGTSADINVTDDPSVNNGPVKKRSLSVDLSDSSKIPASMHITASICEDGLGLISWWSNQENEEYCKHDNEEKSGELLHVSEN